MKKISAIILTLAFAANLTACSKTPSESGSSGGSSDQSGISQTDSTGSSDSSDSSDSTDNPGSSDSSDSSDNSDSSADSEVRALIDAFPEEEFTAPDGSTLKRSDAVKAAEWEGTTFAVGYDFSYIRYAQPIWGSTADDPNFINWDTMKTSGDPLEFPKDAKYFKVKAGDVLENGLTVKEAEYYYGNGTDGTTYQYGVKFDGEISLEGILFCAPSDEYVVAKGDTLFFADPTKYDKIPMPVVDHKMLDSYTDTDVKFSIECDGKRFQLGNYNTLPESVAQLIDEGSAVRARVTLRGIEFKFTPYGAAVFAEVVSAEKV